MAVCLASIKSKPRHHNSKGDQRRQAQALVGGLPDVWVRATPQVLRREAGQRWQVGLSHSGPGGVRIGQSSPFACVLCRRGALRASQVLQCEMGGSGARNITKAFH